MKPHFKLRHAALLAALSAAYPTLALGAGAARVEFSNGNVTAQAPGSAARTLNKGAEIFPGETVLTNEGIAQMRFTDGARVSLKPGSEFRIDEYRYNGKPDGEEKGFFSLLKGGLRTISGLVGRNDRAKYQVRTVSATIGIRGTEYSVTYGNSINVNTGEGVVEVCNTAGCLLLYPGDEGYVREQTSTPVLIQSGSARPSKEDVPPSLSSIEAPGNAREADGTVAGLGTKLTGIQNYTVALSRVTGISVPIPIDETKDATPGAIDAGGALTDFQVTASPWNPGAGGSTESLGNDGVVAWGRWTAGTSGFVIGGSNDGTPGSLLHYVVGLPTLAADPTLPPSATYSLLGGSATVGSTVATVNSASMSVQFGGAPQILDYSIDITAGINYAIASITPIPILPSGNLNFSGPSSGQACAGSICSSVNVSGAFFGSGASRAGLSFSFTDGSTPATGAVALKKN